jgi:hypothetical protein
MGLAWMFVKTKRRPAANGKSNAPGAWLKVKTSLFASRLGHTVEFTTKARRKRRRFNAKDAKVAAEDAKGFGAREARKPNFIGF